MKFVTRIVKRSFGQLDLLILGLNLFLLSMPFFMWHINPRFILLLPFVNAALIFRHIDFSISAKVSLLLIMGLILYAFSLRESPLIPVLSKASVLVILFLRYEKIKTVYEYFKTFMAISFFLSLIVYMPLLFTSIIPYFKIPPLNELKLFDYYVYYLVISELPIGISSFNIRFYGMFDEPGVIGSLAAVFLYIERYNLKSKRNLFLFIGGVMSFSFFFIIASIFYFAMGLDLKKRVLAILLLFLTILLTQNNSLIDELVWSRFEIQYGKLAGDNRSTARLDAEYERFQKSGDFLYGKGRDYTMDYGAGSSSFKLVIMNRGLIYFLLLISFYTLLGIIKIRNINYLILYLFLFFGMLYQRPFFLEINYFFLYYFLPLAYSSHNVRKNSDRFAT